MEAVAYVRMSSRAQAHRSQRRELERVPYANSVAALVSTKGPPDSSGTSSSRMSSAACSPDVARHELLAELLREVVVHGAADELLRLLPLTRGPFLFAGVVPTQRLLAGRGGRLALLGHESLRK
jgi:hypothetical protein